MLFSLLKIALAISTIVNIIYSRGYVGIKQLAYSNTL